jgi:hypothetical protein
VSTTTALTYAGCFLALAALAGFAAASGSHWLLRLPVVAATPLLAFAVWWQLSQRDGWPAAAQPADGSAFVAALVRAPAAGDPGSVYVWVQPPGTTTPRAYRLPYDPGLEREVARAAKAEKRGIQVAVKSTRKPGRHGSQSSRTTLRVVRMPPVPVAEKGRTATDSAG